ncbi:transporter [Plasmodium brasilianum]|uniref:Transporter n=1 Tax=Plasmodium brasilianum TaxID=5824 RepID=A0ACB9YC22_PLABR|nr:transporter [Plasmodium brasilianum]
MMNSYADDNVQVMNNSDDVLQNAEMNDSTSGHNVNDGYRNNNNVDDEYRNGGSYYEKENYQAGYDVDNNHRNDSNDRNDLAQGACGDNYMYDMNFNNNSNKELLLNVDKKKKKNKYDNMFNVKNEKKGEEIKDIPYCSFNNFEEGALGIGGAAGVGAAAMIMNNEEDLNESNDYNSFNKEKLKKMDRKKKKILEKNKKKKKEDSNNNNNSTLDDKKFSEVYNSIYENLKKKKEIKQNNNEGNYTNKNDYYEINYNSSDQVNSVSSVDDDSLFNDDVLKKYIIDEIKKYYINRFYELIFAILLIVDNIQVNISNLIDIDNNGIDFLSKKYDLKINEKAKRKFLTLHQFFFDASFIVVNPLIIFIMYLFSNFFNDIYLRDVFVYLSSFIFAVITIITLVVYASGLEQAERSLRRNSTNDHNYQSQNTVDSIEDGNEEKDYNNENDFERYYEKQNNKNEKYVTYNNYPNIYNDQTKKYLTDRSHVEYDHYNNNNELSLNDQYKKQFSELYNNILRIKNEKTLLFYICSLSYLNSVEDIMILMLIPLTSIYVSEFFYINNIFLQVVVAVILISLTKCFENISYYSNKKNIIALKDIFIGIILSGASLLLSLNLQKYVKESKSDIYNFVGLFMSFVNLIFVILTSFFLSILDNFVINYIIHNYVNSICNWCLTVILYFFMIIFLLVFDNFISRFDTLIVINYLHVGMNV